MQEFKIYAAVAYARANGLNQLVWDSPRPRLGIIACGKAWLDVRQALADIGIDARVAADIGLRLYKVGMVWPLEADGVRRFARGLQEILVIEEKRQIIEYQLKEMLYGWRDDTRPRVVGKFDESGEWPSPPHAWLLPPTGELTPARVARVIASRLGDMFDSAQHAPAPGDAGPTGPGAAAGAQHSAAHTLLLLGLPAQPVDARAAGLLRPGRRGLPSDGGGHEPRQPDDQPDGRRRRHLARHGGTRRNPACVRQHGRRHLFPLRPAGDPRRGRLRRQHQLQAAVQRRGGDDRRATGGRAR